MSNTKRRLPAPIQDQPYAPFSVTQTVIDALLNVMLTDEGKLVLKIAFHTFQRSTR